MKTGLVMAFLLSSSLALAQPGPDTLWTRFYGWTGDDTAFSIQKTADGGFIIAGVATVPQSGYADGFVIKADSNGAMQAWRSYGEDNDDGFYSVAVDSSGGYVMAGYSSNAGGWRRQYFVKVNSVGDVLCSHVLDHTQLYHEWWTSVSVTTTGDFYTAGIGGTVTPGMAFSCAQRFSTECLHTGFPMAWGETGVTVHRSHCYSDGTTITGKWVNDTTSAVQAYLIRWASDVPFIGTYGGDGYDDEAYDAVETAFGYVIAGSSYDGQRYGIFLCATDAMGHPLQLQRHFSDVSEWAEVIIPAMGGGYVIAGSVFNPVPPPGGTDMLLARVNGAGDIVWEKSYGTSADERAYDVVQTADSGFVLVGYSNAHLGVGTEWYFVKTQPDPALAARPPFVLHPSSFILGAYPNPFNPTTTLSFTLPRAGKTSIVIYDVIGREVRILSDEVFAEGVHHIAFDGSSLPSGIYFARMQSGDFAATQKLLLLK